MPGSLLQGLRRHRIGLFCLGVVALNIYIKLTLQPIPMGLPVGTSLAAEMDRAGDVRATVREVATGHRLTVLTFFETWCGPCRLELPVLDRLLAEHPDANLAVLGFYGTSSAAEIAPFARQLGLHFDLLLDDEGSLATALGVQAVPTSYVVDAQLRIVAAAHGFEPSFPTEIRRLLLPAQETP